ncbi:MAG: T9SS type A sorting domain-containing protein [Bacteroidia bacterium]
MKKIYSLLITAMLIAGNINAQITITQSNLPVAGWGFIDAVDSNYTAAIPAGGAGQTWNYASLINGYQDSLLFISSAGTPYAAQFTGANLAAFDPQTGGYAYFTSSASGFYLNGAVSAAFPIPFVLNPPEMFIPVPFTYNSTYSGHSRFSYDTLISGVNYRFVQYTSINILGDGYGSLVIPTGTYPNTLRTKTTSLQIDSAYINVGLGWTPLPGYTPPQTQTTNFKWLQNGGGTLLLEIEADSLGQNATQSSYLLLFVTVGINEIAAAGNLQVYPNPAGDFLNVQSGIETDKATVILSNSLGQQFLIKQFTGNTVIDVSALPHGIYFVTVNNNRGSTIRKISKQ